MLFCDGVGDTSADMCWVSMLRCCGGQRTLTGFPSAWRVALPQRWGTSTIPIPRTSGPAFNRWIWRGNETDLQFQGRKLPPTTGPHFEGRIPTIRYPGSTHGSLYDASRAFPGAPQPWAQTCFYMCAYAVLLQTILSVAVPVVMGGSVKRGTTRKVRRASGGFWCPRNR